MPSLKTLRILAILGPVLVLIVALANDLPLKPRQDTGLFVPIIVVPLVVLFLLILTPSATATIRKRKDILIPLGLLTLAEGLLGWLLLLPGLAAVFNPSWPLQLGALSLTISLGLIINIVLYVGYAAWMTCLVLSMTRLGDSNPILAAQGMRRWFWRVLGLEIICIGVFMLGVVLALMLTVIVGPLSLLLLGVGSLLWNLASSAVLLTALDDRIAFWPALGRGLRVGWANKSRWWVLIVGQMLLLGWIVFISVSYGGDFGFHSSTNWSVNALWVGGYENDCKWYGDLMKALEAPTLDSVNTILGLAFGVLAIGIKLRMAQELFPPPLPPKPVESCDPQNYEPQ